VWRDLRDVAVGGRAFLRALRERDPVEIGLALFAAGASLATRGTASTYTVRIASVAPSPRPVRLLIDFYALNPPAGTDGHHAYFGRRLRIAPRTATTIELRYDWQRVARFAQDGEVSVPDDTWRGPEGQPRLYAVYALLHDPGGAELDRLVIAQELRG
jgi:hypothetical protein